MMRRGPIYYLSLMSLGWTIYLAFIMFALGRVITLGTIGDALLSIVVTTACVMLFDEVVKDGSEP